jgi:prepilin-type N-terminal cleavage/methylation domain-containing protein
MNRISIFKQRTHRSRSGTTARGFTLVELMVVMAMTAIMISVTIVSLSGSRDRKVVEGEARKFAAVVREAQNYALTGKQFYVDHDSNPLTPLESRGVTCSVGIGDIGATEGAYVVTYTYRGLTDCATTPVVGDPDVATNILSNGVRFSSTTSAFNFSVPRGETGLGSTLRIELSKGTDPNKKIYSVCIYPTGRVEDVSGASCP